MKRVGCLYPLIAERDNLLLAFAKAQRGKQDKRDVLRFREYLHEELVRMSQELKGGTITVGDYHYFTIHDPKERRICAAPFRERVLHHAIMNLCEPVFERFAIHHSYACRRGKGNHAAVQAAQQFSRCFPWYLKMDVAKYFDRVGHELLLAYLGRLFKDPQLMALFAKIVQSYETEPGLGIPIGNLTSQHFANFYLGLFDHYVLEALRVRGYVRYMDDMLVWGTDKRELQQSLVSIRVFLYEKLGLNVKDSLEIKPVTAGINFLGFRVFPGRIDLGRRARRRFAGKLKQYEGYYQDGYWNEATLARHAEALVGFTRLAEAGGFRRKVIDDLGRSPQGSNRVNRGGSWNNDNADNFRAANRNNNDPTNRNDNNGFRACLPPAQEFSGEEAADQESVPSVGACDRPMAKSAVAARGW